jgi:hypothetical protein
VSQMARKHQGEKHQLVVLGDLNMVPAPALHSSHSLERGTMRMFQQFLDDHDLENALLTRILEPTLNEGVFSYSDPLKQGLPRSLLDHVLVTAGRTRAAGVLIWPASPRPDAWADHDAVIQISTFARRRQCRPRAGKVPKQRICSHRRSGTTCRRSGTTWARTREYGKNWQPSRRTSTVSVNRRCWTTPSIGFLR